MANFLKKSVLVTFHTLRAHKTLFISLVFLQLLILVLLFTHAFQAQLAIGKDIQQLGTQIQQANYNPEELKEGKPFVQDPLQMLQLYRSLKRNLLLFVVQFSSIFHDNFCSLLIKLFKYFLPFYYAKLPQPLRIVNSFLLILLLID